MSAVVPETPLKVRAFRKEAVPPQEAPKQDLFDWNGAFFAKVREREPQPFVQERLQRRLQHPVCQKCQENYRRKFLGTPFAIECQGIFSEPDFQEVAQLTGLSYEEAREALDISYWANRHISLPNPDGDLVPFIAREYQNEALWCTARRQVDRWGRGLGKSLALDTPVPTPNGWTTQGALRAGDQVFGPDGLPTLVTNVYQTQLCRPCYRVQFFNCEPIIADGSHLWRTWSHPHGARTLSTRHLAELIHQRGEAHSVFGPGMVEVGDESTHFDAVFHLVAIEPVASVPVRCIQVAHPSHLYLAGLDGIPTHNTTTGVIRELHTATNRKRYEILVACPMKAQAQKWYDELNKLIDNDEQLKSSVVQRKQAPYFLIRFENGSTIGIFTTGSKSGSDADSIRSQSPKRVRIDEQDMLNPGDYKSIMPLLRRYPKESEFHGSSTPVGKREDFWAMCTQYPDYRELHFPIMVHPEWDEEMEKACRREARTELNYIHEWLADFGDQEGGCFRAIHVDAALTNYTYPECQYDRTKKHVLGVDWNGQGTGTRFRVVQYDPATKKRRTVDHSMVNISTMSTLDELVKLNRKWHCDYVYVDAGFGFVQDELIRMIGQNSHNPDDRKLLHVQVIDFGAKLVTNKLVVNRDKAKYIDENELERPTKPFMVEGCVMAVEQRMVELSREDRGFEEQIRAYRVKNYTKNGWASSYVSDVGDHDLDAWMLAMLGIEQHWGLSHVERVQHGTAALSFVNGFGEGTVLQGNPTTWQRPPDSARSVAQKKGNVPTRTPKAGPLEAAVKQSGQAQVLTRNLYGSAGTVLIRPTPTPATPVRGAVPSRTGGFTGGLGVPSRGSGRGGYRR